MEILILKEAIFNLFNENFGMSFSLYSILKRFNAKTKKDIEDVYIVLSSLSHLGDIIEIPHEEEVYFSLAMN